MLIKITPITDSDIKVFYINADKVIGLVEYELDDGEVAAVVTGTDEMGNFESIPVRETMEELVAQMQRLP